MVPIETRAQCLSPQGFSIELTRQGDIDRLMVDRLVVRCSTAARVLEAAAIQVTEPLVGKRQPRVLLEGLGLGYAVRKVLQVLPPRARVTVAEPVRELISWQSAYLDPLPEPAKPDHLCVRAQSFRDSLEAHPETFDSMILERDYPVDPFLVEASKPAAYRDAIALLKSALRPRGRLAIHLDGKDVALVKALTSAGFQVDHHTATPHKRSKTRQHFLVATMRAD